jgi:DNA-binding NtrC family response regulator
MAPRWVKGINAMRRARAKARAEGQDKGRNAMTSSYPPSIRLLVVDDDDQMRCTLVNRFERQGMTVTEAASGEEALAKAPEARCDVALLDLHLPGIGGIELLSKLKESRPDLEAIMLTAHSSVETASFAKKCGAYDYLVKPVNLHDLEMYLHKAFEKMQLARREPKLARQLHAESPR